MPTRILFICFAMLGLAGCKALDTPTFQNNYSLYNREAMKAEREGNWNAAAKRYFLALQNAEWAEEGKGVRSDFHFKLGRALGVTCQFEKAEKNLQYAYELNPRLPQALAELGKLKLAQNDAATALSFLERATKELAKTSVSQSDPIGYADTLDDFRKALGLAKRDDEASTVQRQIAALRNAHATQGASLSRAPYGTQCGQKQS